MIKCICLEVFDSLPNIHQGNTFIKEVFKMMPGEVPVTKEDKERILAHWKEITEILDKYKYFSEYTEWATTMSRVKSAAYQFSEWVELLHVIGE